MTEAALELPLISETSGDLDGRGEVQFHEMPVRQILNRCTSARVRLLLRTLHA
jgi:hypothetical protein